MLEDERDEYEDGVLCAWALRFDGPRYFEAHWPEYPRLEAADRAINQLELPANPLQQLGLFYMLQRNLYKWGGERCSRHGSKWRAFRTLFLLTAAFEIDAEWHAQTNDWYQTWERDYLLRRNEAICHVARSLQAMQTPAMQPSDDQVALRYYDRERFLFGEVRERFHEQGFLDAFDFFSIVIWKANRAKSRIACRLLAKTPDGNLETIVRSLTRELHEAKDGRLRLAVLMNRYGFRLPMASAVLTVLWPAEFTVYDVRVCDSLSAFAGLAEKDDVWDEYEKYMVAVSKAVPHTQQLRDKDRVLWSRSEIKQLREDIRCGFARHEKSSGAPRTFPET